MKEYVVGFLHDEESVVLICKNRPEWQDGLLNGVGGKVEFGESQKAAMIREFGEETGVYIGEWDHFATLVGPQARIYCYAAFSTDNSIEFVRTMTDEKIAVLAFESLDNFEKVPNLKWLIPLMLQRENYETIIVPFYGDA
jgi:8-oxo-dGTP diphosphatase